jgi:hypothetical protein
MSMNYLELEDFSSLVNWNRQNLPKAFTDILSLVVYIMCLNVFCSSRLLTSLLKQISRKVAESTPHQALLYTGALVEAGVDTSFYGSSNIIVNDHDYNYYLLLPVFSILYMDITWRCACSILIYVDNYFFTAIFWESIQLFPNLCLRKHFCSFFKSVLRPLLKLEILIYLKYFRQNKAVEKGFFL